MNFARYVCFESRNGSIDYWLFNDTPSGIISLNNELEEVTVDRLKSEGNCF